MARACRCTTLDSDGFGKWHVSCYLPLHGEEGIKSRTARASSHATAMSEMRRYELILRGAIRNAIEQPLHNGEPVGKQVARDECDIVWERLSCARCGAECERTDERVLQLQQEIERLEFQLAFVTGRLVPENRLPC